MSDGRNFDPYTVTRACVPTLDKSQLSLKDVDRTEAIYRRTLVHLADSGFPQLIGKVPTVEQDGDFLVPYDLFISLQYRQDWTPTGYGLGDLIYTVSLLPNEEVTLETKTWETDTRLQELVSEVEERNLSDVKAKQSSAAEVAHGVETKERTYVDAKASYSGFGFSASVSAGWSQDVATMNRSTTQRSHQLARQAVAEKKSREQIKMTVSREQGSESRDCRTLRNINQAHTLNANFFQVLQEFEISTSVESATMVVLGDEVRMDIGVTYEPGTLGSLGRRNYVDADTKSQISWGSLLQKIRSPNWVMQATMLNGFSPQQALYFGWAQPIKEGALTTTGQSTTKDEREAFQSKFLRYVRPAVAWVEPDHSGALRWAYEVIPGQEKDFLMFMMPFVKVAAPQAVNALQSMGVEVYMAEMLVTKGMLPPQLFDVPDTILSHGPFRDMPFEEFDANLPEWVRKIVKMLDDAQQDLGPVSNPDGTPVKDTIVMPTQGVYSDVSLGICSGAEDWIEVNRHLDLNKKEQEIAKIAHENEHRKLANSRLAAGKPTAKYTIKGDAQAKVILHAGGCKCGCEGGAGCSCGNDVHVNTGQDED